MLRHIHIRNFAIIDELDLDLDAGMTALTGETGAGKSILVDALGLVLGDRADSGTVKHGSSKADITVSFDLSDLPVTRAWLEEQDLDTDDECQLRRIIGSDGRSKAYINGTPATLNQLKQLGSMIVEIHGQHEHQTLMHRETQRQLLDNYGAHKTLLDKLSVSFDVWKKIRDSYQALSSSSQERSDRIDMLRYQIEELLTHEVREGEWNNLIEEHERQAHAEQLSGTAQQACQALYEAEEQSVYSILSQQLQAVQNASRIDGSLEPALELLSQARINVQEAHDDLRRYADRIESDPARLNWLEQRMSSLKDLARKHHCEPGELSEILSGLEQELSELDGEGENLEQLQIHLAKAEQEYRKYADQLMEKRVGSARKLSQGVTRAMQTLGMEGGHFEIQVSRDEDATFSPHGMDQIEFEVSANPGQPIRPLARVASGGELARISLAIQMLAAGSLSIPTLIFDEVDSGIGGAVAEIVGRHLRQLGEERQVLCVTHLPQVAAQAHHHFMVQKTRSGRETQTAIRALVSEQRTEEVARMLGGVELTDQTLAHAREMIARAQEA
jgi:DNA repair protein RecN (Recombination protein N)